MGAEGRAEALPDEVLEREEPSGFDQVGHGGGTGPTVSRRFTGVGGALPHQISSILQHPPPTSGRATHKLMGGFNKTK